MKNEKNCKPDFISIGMSRSGTTFVYKILNYHPEIWLPPIKELHYFDNQHNKGRINEVSIRHFKKFLIDFLKNKNDVRSQIRFYWYKKYFFYKRTDEWYESLFDEKLDKISGDYTPSYAHLDDSRIKKIKEINPKIKVIYVMRDPLDRVWSLIAKHFSRKKKKDLISVSLYSMIKHIEKNGIIEKSNYAEIIEKYEQNLPSGNIFIGFLEEIEEDPKKFIERLLDFLGVSSDIIVPEEVFRKPVNSTVSSQIPMPTQLETYLAKKYLPTMKKLKKRFDYPVTRYYDRLEKILNGKNN